MVGGSSPGSESQATETKRARHKERVPWRALGIPRLRLGKSSALLIPVDSLYCLSGDARRAFTYMGRIIHDGLAILSFGGGIGLRKMLRPKGLRFFRCSKMQIVGEKGSATGWGALQKVGRGAVCKLLVWVCLRHAGAS